MESDCLNRALNHIIRVRKKRVHQHETKDDADDGATTKLFHARPCNKHGQNGKSSFHQNGRDSQNVGVHLNAKRVDAVNEAAKKACCHQDGNNGNKDIAQNTRELLGERHAGIQVGLNIGVNTALILARDNIVNTVNKTGAQNHLILFAGEELAFDALNIFDCFLIDLGLIMKRQTQPGRTMTHGPDIVYASNCSNNAVGNGLIISFHGLSPFKELKYK